jgi:hypothetical protein
MELEGSLPLQVPVTCPYPKPDQSIPCSPIPLPEDPSSYYPSFYTCFFQVDSFRFPHQNSVCTSPLPRTCYMLLPSHSSWFDHPNNIWFGVQIIKLLIMCISSLPCSLAPLRPKFPPPHPIHKQPQATSLPQCERPSFTPLHNRQNYSYVILHIFG